MIVIKRYPNRKLYNTSAKRYVTLDGIADLIREGEEVQILDHATSEDLTAVTFTHIIFEQEKKQSGFLPRSVLSGLVQSGGQTLGSLRRTLSTSLDLSRYIDLEIERRIHALVAIGDLTDEEGRDLEKKLLAFGHRGPRETLPSDEELERMLAQRGLPTNDDIRQLNDRLDELTEKLGDVANEPEAE